MVMSYMTNHIMILSVTETESVQYNASLAVTGNRSLVSRVWLIDGGGEDLYIFITLFLVLHPAT